MIKHWCLVDWDRNKCPLSHLSEHEETLRVYVATVQFLVITCRTWAYSISVNPLLHDDVIFSYPVVIIYRCCMLSLIRFQHRAPCPVSQTRSRTFKGYCALFVISSQSSNIQAFGSEFRVSSSRKKCVVPSFIIWIEPTCTPDTKCDNSVTQSHFKWCSSFVFFHFHHICLPLIPTNMWVLGLRSFYSILYALAKISTFGSHLFQFVIPRPIMLPTSLEFMGIHLHFCSSPCINFLGLLTPILCTRWS